MVQANHIIGRQRPVNVIICPVMAETTAEPREYGNILISHR